VVAVHRKHHTFTDREGDPHSPRLLGFWRVQLFNVAYYMREARNAETVETQRGCSSSWATDRVDARRRPPERIVNVLAFSTPAKTEWRWRIVDQRGDILEESSARFPTIADAIAAGTEQVEVRRDGDRPPAGVP